MAIDLRGHGLSDKPNDAHCYTSGAMTEFIRLVMDRLSLTSCALVGHGIGGAIQAHGDIATFEPRDVDEYWAPAQFPEFAGAMRRMVHHFDWSPRSDIALRSDSSALRVVLGSRDRLVDAPAAMAAARRFPGAAVRLVTGAGHVIAEEVPEVVIDELVALRGNLR